MSSFSEADAIARAQAIIEKMGGVIAVSRIVGRAKTRVYSWTYPKVRHGSGGLIPPECQLALLDHARRHNLDLTPGDFFPPEPQEEGVA